MTPNGVAVDGNGNIFVADSEGNTIREVSRSGTVTTIAGTPGVAGYADGTRGIAQFNDPTSIAVDYVGNLYVADFGNNVVRKISPAGVVSTLAGQANSLQFSQEADGVGASAQFRGPSGVSVDASGNVYVTDFYGPTLRRITPSGSVSTIAGQVGSFGISDGTGTSAKLVSPSGIALDQSGSIFILDGDQYIRKIAPKGVVSTALRLPDADPVSGGLVSPGIRTINGVDYFSDAYGIAVDASGNLYIPYANYDTIVKVAVGGAVTTLAGLKQSPGSSDGSTSVAQFRSPTAVALDPSGNLIVADAANGAIRAISPAGIVTTIAGRARIGSDDGSASVARFSFPTGIAVDQSGNMYIADSANHVVRKVTAAGFVTTLAGASGVRGASDGKGGNASFTGPSYITVDSSGMLYVSDGYTIRGITPDGTVTTIAGTPGNNIGTDGTGAAASFRSPQNLAMDNRGNVYVCDFSMVRKVTPQGVVTTLPIPWKVLESGTHLPENFGSISIPRGLAFDHAGNLYIADLVNDVVLRYDTFGVLSVFAGALSDNGVALTGSADGVGAAARFYGPIDMGIDNGGYIYVVDSNNNLVRRIAPDRTVTTIAGAPGMSGATDGIGYAARFGYGVAAMGIAVASDGTIYVADAGNNTVRKGIRAAAVPPSAWLSNFSGRSYVQAGGGAGSLFAGFVTTGAFPKRLVVRADGPGLASFGISDYLPDPDLILFQGQVAAASTTAWNSSLGASFGELGAFPLTPGAGDAALQNAFNPGVYTMQVTSKSGVAGGTCLAEVYDADQGAPSTRLINGSIRAYITTGHPLIAGFVVAGAGTESVLLRAAGPALSAFGVPNALADPVLTIYDSRGNVIGSDSGWLATPVPGNSNLSLALSSAVAATMNALGAFAFAPGSLDCAAELTIPPGAYTATVVSASGASGVALIVSDRRGTW